MKDRNEGRLRDVGHPDDRALIEAAATPPVLPVGFAEQVRVQVQRRLGEERGPRRRRRWAWGIAGVLVTSGALAYPVYRAMGKADPPKPAAPTRTVGQVRPAVEPLPHREPPPAPPAPGAKPEPRTRPRPTTAPAPAVQPGVLAWPLTIDDPTPVADAKPTPPPPQVVILAHPGRREGTLTVRVNPSSDVKLSLVGTVQGTPVKLEWKPPLIVGNIASNQLSIVIHAENARGTIGSWPVEFMTTPTRGGRLLRGRMPGHDARVELEPAKLSWYPGCERDLAGSATVPRTFEGGCAQEPRARVTLPQAFLDLPDVPRLVLLAILLTDRDPVYQAEPPFLYGPRAR